MEARVEKPHRIAGYCRISVDVEADRDNTSIENQKDIISDYVQRYFPNSELTLFVDRDRSGYTFEQREDYQRMRPYLMTGQYDILIIKDLSRFSRRNSRGLVELEDLRDAGVRIVAIGDSIDYPTHDDWTNIRLRFLLNEMPVTDSSQKVKSVISRRQQDGRWICSVPYGYAMKNHKLMTYEIDPVAAEVVRKIFELYTSGWGYKRIANYLTDHSIPTPRRAEAARKAGSRSFGRARMRGRLRRYRECSATIFISERFGRASTGARASTEGMSELTNPSSLSLKIITSRLSTIRRSPMCRSR